MAINQLTKQPAETFPIYGGITNVAQDGETIDLNSSSVTCVDKNGADASDLKYGSPSLSTNGLRLYQRIAKNIGTEALSPYCMTFTMVTTDGNEFEKDAYIFIKGRP